MPLGVDFLEAVEAGLDGTEHLYYLFKGTRANREEVTRRVRAGELGFWGAFWTMLDAPDPEREAEVLAAMADRGSAIIPTLRIGDVLSRVEVVDHEADPELAFIAARHVDSSISFVGSVHETGSTPHDLRSLGGQSIGGGGGSDPRADSA